jgi:GTP-binding protein HflX
LTVIDQKLQQGHRVESITVNVVDGKAIAWIHAHAEILKQEAEEEVIHFSIRVSEKDWGRLQKMVG